ncbi:MAG: DUF3326 domain-containing protein [Deltaproteobacteria bacterium]|nr:DUF3326 domain-containing protein [Deltaproteobacteria bacterium]
MLLIEKEIYIPSIKQEVSRLKFFERAIKAQLSPSEVSVRFAVTKSDADGYHCELGILTESNTLQAGQQISIFDFEKRRLENTDKFNAVMIVPTGIGAELGGHAGDATPAARLLAGACDKLITHPNVVNASDINEMPENGLYVEGSVISRLLMGTIGLQVSRSNRILLIIDEHEDKQIAELAINAASAARITLGLDCAGVVKIDPPVYLRAEYSSSGSAVGRVEGLERLLEVIDRHRSEFDAVALASKVDISEGLYAEYFRSDGKIINPWGGVEAMLTHSISLLFNVPSAHAPMAENMQEANAVFGIVDPRMSPEAVSSCFLHCVLKGLHKSPQIITDRSLFTHSNILTATDISCLVIPDGCIGLPTLAALEQGIPVIAVRENRNRMENDLAKLSFAPGKLFIVDNYLEAVGVMTALKCGISVTAVRRPLADTYVTSERLCGLLKGYDSDKIPGEASTVTSAEN